MPTDPNAALRAVLDRLAGPAAPVQPEGPRRSVTTTPAGAPPAWPTTAGGRQEEPTGHRQAEAATDTARRPSLPPVSPTDPPAAPLELGDVVYWRTTRQHGWGQVSTSTAELVVVRPFLPVRSHTVTVPRARVQRVCAALELAGHLLDALDGRS